FSFCRRGLPLLHLPFVDRPFVERPFDSKDRARARPGAPSRKTRPHRQGRALDGGHGPIKRKGGCRGIKNPPADLYACAPCAHGGGLKIPLLIFMLVRLARTEPPRCASRCASPSPPSPQQRPD